MTTSAHYNGDMYAAAHAELGNDDVLLESTVVSVKRGYGEDGAGNMEPIGLDDYEGRIFGRLTHNGFYAGLVNTMGLMPAQRYRNIKLSARFNVPENGLYEILPTAVPGVFVYCFVFEIEQAWPFYTPVGLWASCPR